MSQTTLYKPLTGQYGFWFEQDRLDTLTNIGLSTVANTPAAADVDWSLSNVHTKSISTNTVLTFSNTTQKAITIAITATGAYTVTWPTIKWAAGSAPVQTSTATDVYIIEKIGSTFYGRRSIAAAA